MFRNKKPLIIFAVFVLLATSAFFMVNVRLPEWSHYISGINVVLFALPLFWALRRWLGMRDAIVLIALFAVLSMAIEISAIATGFPYGHFGYSELLGFRVFGSVPWTVAFAWTPLVFTAYAAAVLIGRSFVLRLVLTVSFLIAFDLVLDPGAVRLGFWQYNSGGGFYGVPVSNFAGWAFSAALGFALIEIFVRIRRPLLPMPVQLMASGIFIIVFWTAISFFGAMIWPALIGAVICGLLAVLWFRKYYAFDDMIVFVDENNEPIGTSPKLAAHDADTKLHRAFSVFIFNRKGELLLQQRALSKKTWPGTWSNSCCGHVMLHETVEAAAKRRLNFELGMSGVELKVVLPKFRYRAEKGGVVENELCPVLVGFTEAEPKPNPSEVNAVRYVNWTDFRTEVAIPENEYSPWAIDEVEQLARNELFLRLFDDQTV